MAPNEIQRSLGQSLLPEHGGKATASLLRLRLPFQFHWARMAQSSQCLRDCGAVLNDDSTGGAQGEPEEVSYPLSCRRMGC